MISALYVYVFFGMCRSIRLLQPIPQLELLEYYTYEVIGKILFCLATFEIAMSAVQKTFGAVKEICSLWEHQLCSLYFSNPYDHSPKIGSPNFKKF